MLKFDRKQQNSIEQLSLNKKKKKKENKQTNESSCKNIF